MTRRIGLTCAKGLSSGLRALDGIETDFGNCADQIGRPTVNVVVLHHAPHAPHPLPFLTWVHLEGIVDRVCNLIGIIWIHNQRVFQLKTSTGEKAQNEDAIFVASRGDEFFRNQIHAVVQRCHQTNVRHSIIRLDLVVIEVPFQKDNWFPLPGLESLVDALRFRFYVRDQVLIAVDMGTAGSADLYMREAALVGRMLLQKPLNASKSLRDALGVVQPIDTNPQVISLAIEPGCDGSTLGAHGQVSIGIARCAFLEVDADGEGTNRSKVAALGYRKALPFDPRFQRPVNGLQEIVAVRLDVKADQVRAQQPLEQFPSPRTNTERF